MNGFLLWGSILVTLALVAYSCGFLVLRRRGRLSFFAFCSMLLGLFLDATATGLMILGSTRGLWTGHGLMGYSALALMVLEVLLLSRLYRREGPEAPLSGRGRVFLALTYYWWVVVYLLGVLLAMERAHH